MKWPRFQSSQLSFQMNLKIYSSWLSMASLSAKHSLLILFKWLNTFPFCSSLVYGFDRQFIWWNEGTFSNKSLAICSCLAATAMSKGFQWLVSAITLAYSSLPTYKVVRSPEMPERSRIPSLSMRASTV